MTFQQQVAVWLTLTVVCDNRDRSFVIVSLNWLVLALVWMVALAARAWGWVERVAAGVARWWAGLVLPLGPRAVWGIG